VNQQCKLQWKQWLKETKCPTSIRAAAAKFDILYPTLRKHIIKGTATKLLGCLRRTFPMQPIRTKFSICGHVKGWQRSSNFGRNWPILDKTGVAQVTGSAFFLFGKPDDLSTTSHRPISIKFCHETYFDFRGHFTPKSEIENRSNRHLNQKRLHVTECTAEILFTPYKTLKMYLQVTNLQPRGYIAKWFRFFHVTVERPKRCLPAPQVSCDFW